MRDMQVQLDKLRAQLAECEAIRNTATDDEKRRVFDILVRHLKLLTEIVEHAVAAKTFPVTFLGRKTHEPFSREGG